MTKDLTDSQQVSDGMSGWCEEKAESVTEELAMLVEELHNDDNIDEDTKEKIWEHIYPALYNSTKLLSFFCKAEWSHEDRDIIFKKGYKGYEELSVKYGLLDETSESKLKKEIEQFIRRFKIHLDGSIAPNRTFIHELLQSQKLYHPIINDLSDITEKVSMGEMDWQQYVTKASSFLNRLSKIELSDIKYMEEKL